MADTRADERFAAKYQAVTESGCWIWTAAANTFGYGKMSFEGRIQDAHRISWQLYRGQIPDGMCVCHSCDVPQCVNPAHLFLGTHQDNTQDCLRKGRNNPPRGARSGKAVLSEQQVLEIRNIRGRLPDGEAKRIARKYGVNDATIWRIRNSQRWGHIHA